MKKIEASLIKRLLRITWQASSLQCEPFVSSVLELSHYSLSLSHTLGELDFSWSTLGGCGIHGFLEQEGNRRVGNHERASTSATTSDCLQVSSLTYEFFTSFGLHDTSMWLLGYDMSLAWRMVRIDIGFPSLSISWIAMGIVGLLSLLCLVWFSCFLGLG